MTDIRVTYSVSGADLKRHYIVSKAIDDRRPRGDVGGMRPRGTRGRL